MNVGKLYRSSFNLKHIITIIAAVTFYVAAMFLFNEKIDAYSKYHNFLSSRHYSHSVLVDRSLEQDSYAYYGKKIIFSINENMDNYINCDTIMETENGHSDADFLYPFDPSKLESNEIAVSKNLMVEYALSVGDIVYSKHTYKNEIISYTVKSVLPEIYGIKERDFNINSGIVLVGFDKEYLDNIYVEHVFFYNEDSSLINSSGANVKGDLFELKEAIRFINLEKAKYIGITSGIMTVVSAISSIALLSFNKNIYILKKRYGNSDSYAYFIGHSLIYQVTILTLSLAAYCVSMAWNPFVLLELLALLIAGFIPNLIINLFFLSKMRRL